MTTYAITVPEINNMSTLIKSYTHCTHLFHVHVYDTDTQSIFGLINTFNLGLNFKVNFSLDIQKLLQRGSVSVHQSREFRMGTGLPKKVRHMGRIWSIGHWTSSRCFSLWWYELCPSQFVYGQNALCRVLVFYFRMVKSVYTLHKADNLHYWQQFVHDSYCVGKGAWCRVQVF